MNQNRPRRPSVLLAVFCLLIAPSLAAAEGDGPLPFPAGDLPDLTFLTVGQETGSAPNCLLNSLTLTIGVPQGLGLPGLDKAMVDQSVELLKKRYAELKGTLCDEATCGGASCGEWFWRREVSLYVPSAGYVSILFSDSSYLGGAHENLEYEVQTYGPDGRSLTLTDLFPDPGQSAPRYWAYVHAQWCAAHGVKYPPHFDGGVVTCRPGDSGQPRENQKVAKLADLGRLIFTDEGATLVLGPYESGSFAAGTMTLDIPKAEFIEMGAAPKIWGE